MISEVERCDCTWFLPPTAVPGVETNGQTITSSSELGGGACAVADCHYEKSNGGDIDLG